MPRPHPSSAEASQFAGRSALALLALGLTGLLAARWPRPLAGLALFGAMLAALALVIWWLVRRTAARRAAASPVPASPAPLAASKGDTTVIPRRMSGLNHRQRLRAADWFQFEQVIAAISVAGGHEVRRLGPPGGNGDVDLLVERGGETAVVRCRHRRDCDVDLHEVGDLLSSMLAAKARRGVLVTLGVPTEPAREFARTHRIQLVAEDDIVARLEQLRGTGHWPQLDGCLDSLSFHCPRCEAPLAEQTADLVGLSFLACSRSPRCDYVAAASSAGRLSGPSADV